MMTNHWRERARPVRLEKRFEFSSYDELSEFLDQAADLSENKGLYPDMGFGRDYVNMTIYAEEDQSELSQDQFEFVKQIEAIIDSGIPNRA